MSLRPSPMPATSLTRRAAIAGGGAGAAGLLMRTQAGLAATPEASPAASPAATPAAGEQANPVLASVPRMFQYDAFQFDFLNVLGAIYERAADVGECFAAASQIKDGDFQSWVDVWTAWGDRLAGIGDASAKAGHRLSASEAYLRASTYYSAAQWYGLAVGTGETVAAIFEKGRAAFDNFASRLDVPGAQIEIAYEGTTLPGYAFTVDTSGEPRPWFILNNGSDGAVAEAWVTGMAAALRRGYNVLTFDGPGQGAALFRQKLSFRYDWEKVITPVVDYLLTRKDVDANRIGILGLSQGGYWVPRALAFEHRIAAAVLDPGVFDVSTSWTSQIPPDALEGLYNTTGAEQEKIKAEFDQGVQEEMAKNAYAKYTIESRMFPYGTTSFSDTLLLLKDYTLAGTIDMITTPLIIASPEGESFWPGQSQEVYDKAPATLDKTLVP
ncbi:MAG: alpha/beta hydrolase family protein, partial [Thermomicrobiales bacterium]